MPSSPNIFKLKFKNKYLDVRVEWGRETMFFSDIPNGAGLTS
jgi:galactokinase